MVFLMTDGKPSDMFAYTEACKAIKDIAIASIVCCAIGKKADTEHLKLLSSQIVALETLDSNAFAGFFKWISVSVASGSSSSGINISSDDLPPPPPEIQLVL